MEQFQLPQLLPPGEIDPSLDQQGAICCRCFRDNGGDVRIGDIRALEVFPRVSPEFLGPEIYQFVPERVFEFHPSKKRGLTSSILLGGDQKRVL